ncbi:hypothetical protein [Oleiharenicola lentus]|uniref:hypothetical protein n=1 Tax=Oleiharenicola lentus TaxID=2508720 RepID=UPI003F6682A9
MNTCCTDKLAHVTSAPSSPARRRRYGFASLLKIFNQPGLPSVDLADSHPPIELQQPVSGAIAAKEEFGPLPASGRPAHTRFMPWRLE